MRRIELKKGGESGRGKEDRVDKTEGAVPSHGVYSRRAKPVGMKKLFRTGIDRSAEEYEGIFHSAGKIGFQVETSPYDLKNDIHAEFADIAENP